MLRKIVALVGIAVISIFCLSGCKERPEEVKLDRETVKTTAEYQAEAREQITKGNMANELDKIEKVMEQEAGQGR